MKVKLKYNNIKDNYITNLLHERGVEDIERFLNPTADDVQTWEDLENIYDGVNLIKNLPENAIIGQIIDCDCDGLTSGAIFYQYMMYLRPDVKITYYLHESKAHGLEEHYEEMLDKNYDLVVVIDAGSNDSQYASQFNCPVLVIDHHLVEDLNFADNMVIINNQLSPNYHNKALSGAGMAFQFCRAMDKVFGVFYSDEFWDLAATGICGDMMNGLEIENQYFWKYGFSHIKNYFLYTLARHQAYSITGETDASDEKLVESLTPIAVAFYIVPLLNAMIRVGTMAEKQRLFMAFIEGHTLVPCLKRGAKGTYEEVAIESTRECVNARSHQNKFKDNAVARLEAKIMKHDLLENQILFVRLDDDDDFPSELNGLVAMTLSAKYNKPTIVARLNNEGFIRGSARGVNNSELLSFKDFLTSTDLFEYTMGHDQAFGCSIANTNLDQLHKIANTKLLEYNLGQTYYEVDFDRSASAMDIEDLIIEINNNKDLWSTNNDEPLIYVHDIYCTKKDIQIMGKTKNTVKIVNNGITYIKFFADDMISEIENIDSDDLRIEIVGKANLNIWMGHKTPQIFIDSFEVRKDDPMEF